MSWRGCAVKGAYYMAEHSSLHGKGSHRSSCFFFSLDRVRPIRQDTNLDGTPPNRPHAIMLGVMLPNAVPQPES